MSTYSTSLKLTLIGDGEQSGTWGQTTNANLGTLLEQAITGVTSITMSDATYTLTDLNGVADEARNAVIIVGGTNSAQRDVIAPAVEKLYVVKNATSGGYTIRFKTSSGTAITIPNGMTVAIYCDGTDFYEQQTGTTGNFPIGGNVSVGGNATVTGTLAVTGATTLTTPLGVSSGGTGGSTSTGSGAVVLATSPSLITPSLGVATATSVNKITLTQPATGSTLTVADGKTLTASNTLTLAGTDATTMTFPPASSSVGYLNVPINSQSTNYTLVSADSGKTILHPSTDTNDRTFTIPANSSVAYDVGTAITFINMSTNSLSIAITTDTMYLAGAGTTGTRTLLQYGIATAVKLTSTTWLISGNGLT